MNLLKRLSRQEVKDHSEEISEIYDEMLQMHQRIEFMEGQLSTFQMVNEQLEDATMIKESAYLVSEKLKEMYQEIQITKDVNREENLETKNYIHQLVKQMEDSVANMVRFTDQHKNEMTSNIKFMQDEVTNFQDTYTRLVESTKEELKQEMEVLYEEKRKESQMAQQQLQNQIEQLNSRLQEEQQALRDFQLEVSHRDREFQKQVRQKNLMIYINYVLFASLVIWNVWK